MATVQRLQCLRSHLTDQPGALLKIMQELKSKKYSLKGLWGYGKEGGEGDLFVVGKDLGKIRALLGVAGLPVENGSVFFFSGVDKTGALVGVLQTLTDASINIKAINAVAIGGKFGSLVWVDAADVDKTAKALKVK